MANGLIDTSAQVNVPEDRRIYGVTLAQVIDNLDQTNQGRVQLHLPWLPGYEPWARLAVLMAGPNRGTYFVPQVGDEVLVAFEHGDVRDPFVIGSLWNGRDLPPKEARNAPVDKRVICTPKGHKITFDDAAQSVEVTHAKGAKLKLTSEDIELSISCASLKMDKDGNITLKANTKISLEAQNINISADAKVDINGRSSTDIKGGSSCTIDAAQIFIG
jgi:uncharacterized protein involved in type VI secretion and phage assembly